MRDTSPKVPPTEVATTPPSPSLRRLPSAALSLKIATSSPIFPGIAALVRMMVYMAYPPAPRSQFDSGDIENISPFVATTCPPGLRSFILGTGIFSHDSDRRDGVDGSGGDLADRAGGARVRDRPPWPPRFLARGSPGRPRRPQGRAAGRGDQRRRL